MREFKSGHWSGKSQGKRNSQGKRVHRMWSITGSIILDKKYARKE